MATFVTGFVVADIANTHRLFNAAIREWGRVARAAPDPVTRRTALRVEAELLVAYKATNEELNALAAAGAKDARRRMREKFDTSKARRPKTGKEPHLRRAIDARALIVSRGLGTGAVGVGHIEKLDKVVNPVTPQYGPYWRAQNYGSPKMKGRIIRGYFFGPGYGGDPEPPRGQYAGTGGGPHPLFVSAKHAAAIYGSVGFAGGGGKQGGRGGFGTINHPIKARRFIEEGAALAYGDWIAGLRAVEGQAITRMRAASALGASGGRRRR